MKLDILAFGAHPDDVELGASGILHKHKLMGKKVGIVDLTEGELGSRGTVVTRYQEAKASSALLQIDIRENLQMADGFFENNQENKLKIIQVLRKYQPNIVLINAPYDRHPDHGRGATIVKDACFLAGLIKVETQNNGETQKPWRPSRIFHYIQDTFIEPDIIVDISDVYEVKKQAILCYSTQFFNPNPDDTEPRTYISGKDFLESIENRDRLNGKKIGVQYGEGLLKAYGSIGINDLFALKLPDIV